jgi:hypothetical protein
MVHQFRFGVGIVLMASLLCTSAQRHSIHASLTQIDHNAKGKTLEVSVRIFTDDLENVLSLENKGQRFRIEDGDKNDAVVERYLRKVFKITNAKGKIWPYTYIGKENEADATWAYIEIPLTEAPTGCKLQQQVLLDVFDDQVNIVNVTYQGEKKTYLFNLKTKEHLMP